MTTLQPGQVTTAGQIGPNGGTATVDELGYLHHPDLPWPVKTNDTGDSGVSAPAGLAVVPSATGGSIGPTVAVSYKVTAITAVGESLPSAAVADTTSGGTTDKVTLTWAPVAGATGYKVYGRTAAAWGLLATVTDPTYVDTGAASVGAVPPVANTSGDLAAGVEGPGHVIGGTFASGKVRPTVDTRNATNVGAATGPDVEAPRVYES